VTLQFLPAKSPELNSAEQPWREIRQKYWGNRAFPTVEELDDAIADAWMQLIRNRNGIQSLGAYHWIMNITQN
jgi:transposase